MLPYLGKWVHPGEVERTRCSKLGIRRASDFGLGTANLKRLLASESGQEADMMGDVNFTMGTHTQGTSGGHAVVTISHSIIILVAQN